MRSGFDRARERPYNMVGPYFSAFGRSSRRCDATEASLAPVEVAYRRRQVLCVEVGPHPRDEKKLGVGALPQEKVAQSLLSSGADEQVHVGGGARRVGDPTQELREVRGLQLLVRAACADSLEEGVAARVVHRETKGESSSSGRLGFGGETSRERVSRFLNSPDSRQVILVSSILRVS